MPGISSKSGILLDDVLHLKQSILDILKTPIGSRVMRREYGSEIYKLIDRPMTPALMVEIVATIAKALRRWEPRFILSRVEFQNISAGAATVDLVGRLKQTGNVVIIDGLTL